MPTLKLSIDPDVKGRFCLELPERLPLSVYMEDGFFPQRLEDKDSRYHRGIIQLINPAVEAEELPPTSVCFYFQVGGLYDRELLSLLSEEIFLPVMLAIYERFAEISTHEPVEVSDEAYALLKQHIEVDVGDPWEFVLHEKGSY
jgi:hypothetical protein